MVHLLLKQQDIAKPMRVLLNSNNAKTLGARINIGLSFFRLQNVYIILHFDDMK